MSWSADEEDDQAWDDLFSSHAENVGDYLNPEGLEREMQDIGSSGHIEVTTHGDETEDMKISETYEASTENISFPVASIEPADKPATEIAFAEMPASKVPSPIEAIAIEHITTANVLIETTQGEAAGSEVTIITTISVGND